MVDRAKFAWDSRDLGHPTFAVVETDEEVTAFCAALDGVITAGLVWTIPLGKLTDRYLPRVYHQPGQLHEERSTPPRHELAVFRVILGEHIPLSVIVEWLGKSRYVFIVGTRAAWKADPDLEEYGKQLAIGLRAKGTPYTKVTRFVKSE